MRHRPPLSLLLFLPFFHGCYSPNYGDVGFQCGAGGACPDGYECRADDRCHRIGSPDELPDAGGGGQDAPPSSVDAAPGAPDGMSSPDAGDDAPANDQCGDAELLVPGMTAVGTLEGAASDDDFTCGGTGESEVYYGFNITENKHVTITSGSTIDSRLSLLADDCATEVACVDGTSFGEIIDVENLPAGAYFVAVEASSGADFTLDLEVDDPIVRPPNDTCEDVIPLSSGVTRVGDSMEMALDDVQGACSAGSEVDVVYSFEVSGENQRAVVTVSEAVGFDPRIVLTSGACPGTEIACSQDRDDQVEVLDAFDLAPGTYHVWVEADGASPESFDVSLELLPAVPPPDNDTCSAPDVLAEGDPVQATTLGAADDYDLQCLAFDGPDAVHQFTLDDPAAVLVTVDPTDPAGWPLAASLRDDATCTDSADLSCVAGAFATRFINQPSLGAGVYDVIVDGLSGESGDYTIQYETRAADDGFGYWMFERSGESYSPLTGATELTLEDGLAGDEKVFPVSLPFSFPFYGNSYDSVNISINGYLTFGPVPSLDSDSYTNDCPFDTSSPNDMIALFWDDQFTPFDNAPALRHKIEGTAPFRRFVVEYVNFDIWQSPPCSGQGCKRLGVSVTQKVILHEDGDIEFRYGPRTEPSEDEGCTEPHRGCSATIGLENAAGTESDQASCNTATIDEGDVIYFVHPR